MLCSENALTARLCTHQLSDHNTQLFVFWYTYPSYQIRKWKTWISENGNLLSGFWIWGFHQTSVLNLVCCVFLWAASTMPSPGPVNPVVCEVLVLSYLLLVYLSLVWSICVQYLVHRGWLYLAWIRYTHISLCIWSWMQYICSNILILCLVCSWSVQSNWLQHAEWGSTNHRTPYQLLGISGMFWNRDKIRSGMFKCAIGSVQLGYSLLEWSST